jgi:hypothetical protein
MKKKDINYEFISKIEIKLDDTIFYVPGETIKGKINIIPKYQMKINDDSLHITLKIMQYEFWDYSNQEIKELKNVNITIIQTEEIIYELKEGDLSESKNFENFSIIDLENENKIISIPFEFKITEEKILPTFQFDSKTYFLGIRHLLLAECKEYNSSNYIGLFIGKNRNKDFIEPKHIKESYTVGSGTLDIEVNYPTQSYKFDEIINLDIQAKSNLNYKKITEVKQKYYRNIHWIGYMKNTLLNKTIFHTQKYTLNESKFGLLEKINAPLLPIEKTIYESSESLFMGAFFSSIFGPFGALIGILGIYAAKDQILINGLRCGIIEQGEIVREIFNTDNHQKDFSNNFKTKLENDVDEKIINDNLKKFVYFKDNKIVGFIKFTKDITPPVEGYYFKCDFNLKVEIQISGIILNRNRYLKTKIDMYDSDTYITQMKKILKN